MAPVPHCWKAHLIGGEWISPLAQVYLWAGQKIVDQIVARSHPSRDDFVQILVLLSLNLETRGEHTSRLLAQLLRSIGNT